MSYKDWDWKPITETLLNFKKNVGSKEDWFTECIKLALCYNGKFATDFINEIRSESGLTNGEQSFTIERINTQVSEDNGIYDLKVTIMTPQGRKKIIIEVKRGAEISRGSKNRKLQLPRYIEKADYLVLISTRWHSRIDLKEVYDNPKYLHPKDQNNFLWCHFYKLLENQENEVLKFIKEYVMNKDRPVDLSQISEYLRYFKERKGSREELFHLHKDCRLRAKIVEIATKIGEGEKIPPPEEGGSWSSYKIKKGNREIFIGFNYPYWPQCYTGEILKKFKETEPLKNYIMKIPQARGEKEVVETPCFFVYEERKEDIKDLKPECKLSKEKEGVYIYVGKGKFTKEKQRQRTCKVAIFNLLDILGDDEKDVDIDIIAKLLEECIEIVLK